MRMNREDKESIIREGIAKKVPNASPEVKDAMVWGAMKAMDMANSLGSMASDDIERLRRTACALVERYVLVLKEHPGITPQDISHLPAPKENITEALLTMIAFMVARGNGKGVQALREYYVSLNGYQQNAAAAVATMDDILTHIPETSFPPDASSSSPEERKRILTEMKELSGKLKEANVALNEQADRLEAEQETLKAEIAAYTLILEQLTPTRQEHGGGISEPVENPLR